MSNIMQYRDKTDTSRNPSPSIWASCPVLEFMRGNGGVFFHDDFLNGLMVPTTVTAEATYGKYRAWTSQSAVPIDDGLDLGGSLVFAADGDDEGAGIAGATAFQISASVGKLWFEACFKTSTIADTKHGIFIGLMDETAISNVVPIVAAGTLANVNFVGFHRLEGDGDMLDLVYKADGVTQVNVATDAFTLVADTWTKVGFLFDPSNSNKLKFFRDGGAHATTKTIPNATGTDFPADVRMGLVFDVLNATGTTPGSSRLEWWRIAQERS